MYDGVLFRFTVFDPSGAYVSDVPAPFLDPLRSFDTVLSGVVWRGWIPDSLMTRFDVDVATGEVVREEASPNGPWGAACGGGEAIAGIPDRSSGWVFVACGDRLIFVGGAGAATVLPVPTHFPDERDVERLEYLGSVRVRGRLRAFDLLGSTLVALVERRAGADDADGVPDRALDWYDIGELPFGR